MQLTVRQAASYLGVTEAVLRQWISTRDVPVHRAHEREFLNAVELWEWAVERGIPVSRSLLERARRAPDAFPALSVQLRQGGIYHDVPGASKPAVLREIVARMPLPPSVDRDFLCSVLEVREALGSTAIGDGIAIPHIRNPIALHVEAPFVTLCFLKHSVDFGAVDGRPVHALFTVVSPTIPGHLFILAQLGFVLRDPALRRLVEQRGAATDILDRIEMVETQTTGEHHASPRPSSRP